MALLARLLIVVAVLAVVPFIAIGGLSRVKPRATSTEGLGEALAERQGGSMPFPTTTLRVHRRGGWLHANGPDWIVAHWSDKGELADRPRAACGIRLVALA